MMWWRVSLALGLAWFSGLLSLTAVASPPSSSLSSGRARAVIPMAPLPRLRISEVMMDPLLVEDRAGEYVEIVNLSPCPVRLSELALVIPSGHRLALPPGGAELPSGGVVVFSPAGFVPGSLRLKGLRLPGRAGRLELRWRGVVVDIVQWTGRWPWPKHKSGRAIERRSPETDGRSGRSWRHSRTPLRKIERGSPGVKPSGVRWRPSIALGAACRRGRSAPL